MRHAAYLARFWWSAAVLGAFACGASSAPTAATPHAPLPLACNPALWAHTYSKDRFRVINLCAHETVTVTRSYFAEDGDLNMDATDAGGQFVHIEIPCARSPNTSTGSGREAADQHVCDGIVPASPPALPAPGVRLEVAGPNVIDLRHNWREIHGATYRVVPDDLGLLSWTGIFRAVARGRRVEGGHDARDGLDPKR